ncbi:MAG: choice-of-anchor V domain-containing protein, partial [Bacteroidota bacterium]
RPGNIAAGFNVAAFFGSLGITDSVGTQLLPGGDDTLELTHTEARLAGGRDTISWSFSYRAPFTIGQIDTLYVSGNTVDTSFDPTGDHWNFAEYFLVRVVRPTSVQEWPVVQSFRLAQNYPNPFNPSTVIRFEMPVAGQASLAVFDMMGRKVRELVNGYMSSGTHEAIFVAEGDRAISSGVYLYQLVVQPSGSQVPFVATQKMLLLK